MTGDLRICLVGATGYTGRLVAERLLELGVRFDALTRATRRLPASWQARAGAFGVIEADLLDPVAVERLATPDRLFINCAGPFHWYSRELVRAVARCGAAYLDVCGEAAFVAFTRSELHATARRNDALLVHACALESLPADLLAASLCTAGTAYADISSYYMLPPGAASRGTRLSMRLTAAQTAYAWENHRYVERVPGRDAGPLDLPFTDGIRHAVFAPYPELQFWPARYDTHTARSCLLVPPLQAAFMQRRERERPGTEGGETAPAGARANEAALLQSAAASGERSGRDGPPAEARRGHEFTVAVLAQSAGGAVDLAWLTGRDPYGVTAYAAVWAALEIASCAVDRRTGVIGPADVLDARRFFRTAASWPFQISLHRGPASAVPG